MDLFIRLLLKTNNRPNNNIYSSMQCLKIDLCVICQIGKFSVLQLAYDDDITATRRVGLCLFDDTYRLCSQRILTGSRERVGCLRAHSLFIVVRALTGACLLLRCATVLIRYTFPTTDEFISSQELSYRERWPLDVPYIRVPWKFSGVPDYCDEQHFTKFRYRKLII